MSFRDTLDPHYYRDAVRRSEAAMQEHCSGYNHKWNSPVPQPAVRFIPHGVTQAQLDAGYLQCKQ